MKQEMWEWDDESTRVEYFCELASIRLSGLLRGQVGN